MPPLCQVSEVISGNQPMKGCQALGLGSAPVGKPSHNNPNAACNYEDRQAGANQRSWCGMSTEIAAKFSHCQYR
jgi:hypothetical protein